MAAAQQVLGIDHRWLGYVDSGLPDDYTRDRADLLPAGCFALVPLEVSAEPLVRIIRQTRPQVLITYDEDGGYPHPDHIRTHELSLYAWEAAADPARYPDQGAPWRIAKVYFDRIFNSHRVGAVHDALVAAGHERAADIAQLREWMRDSPDLTTTQVPVGDYLDIRDAALRSHASQVAPDDRFFFWPNDVQREAWPYEDFQLVVSSVETTLPESDLFAGIGNTGNTTEDDQ
jgi:mycothiol S-conjugate amidase